jgi:hypothetical protein
MVFKKSFIQVFVLNSFLFFFAQSVDEYDYQFLGPVTHFLEGILYLYLTLLILYFSKGPKAEFLSLSK